jgi:hypothetical protein
MVQMTDRSRSFALRSSHGHFDHVSARERGLTKAQSGTARERRSRSEYTRRPQSAHNVGSTCPAWISALHPHGSLVRWQTPIACDGGGGSGPSYRHCPVQSRLSVHRFPASRYLITHASSPCMHTGCIVPPRAAHSRVSVSVGSRSPDGGGGPDDGRAAEGGTALDAGPAGATDDEGEIGEGVLTSTDGGGFGGGVHPKRTTKAIAPLRGMRAS